MNANYEEPENQVRTKIGAFRSAEYQRGYLRGVEDTKKEAEEEV